LLIQISKEFFSAAVKEIQKPVKVALKGICHAALVYKPVTKKAAL